MSGKEDPASLLWIAQERDRQALTFADRYLFERNTPACDLPGGGTFSNVLTGTQVAPTVDRLRQMVGRIKREQVPLQPTREIVPPGFPRLVPTVPIHLLAAGYELRTSRLLHGPYRRERFSGGVNLTAQAYNQRIDSQVYVAEPPGAPGMLYVSPRLLKHLKGLKFV